MTPDDLSAVLACYPAIARPLSGPEPLGNAGGSSGARLWRFRSGRGLLVARAWPPDGPDREVLERVHRWLARATGLGFVPAPLPGLDGRSIRERSGRLWEVAPWLPGRAEADRPPPRARLRAAFAALAALHRALEDERTIGPIPGIVARLREVEALTGGGFEALGRALGRAPDDPCRDDARRWLELALWAAPRLVEPALRQAAGRIVRLQPALRDARPEHILFEGDRVSGLVDFGAMAIDTVAADLARLLSEWLGPDRPARAEALDAYAAVRPLDRDEVALIDVFEASAALLGAGHWARWHFLERRTFEDPSAVARGLARGLERLARLAAEG
jgi:homoserine kinase type II